MKDFPINVFPDVERNAFKKFSKKNVTEDYIKENLKRKGWECYKPFTDTGIDLLATKIIDSKRIYRYIQIKTRALDDDIFGYSLTSKDFVTDPRKIYFLFCDTVDDVIILSSYDYFKIFYENEELGNTHFAIPSFRNNNNKLNSLQYVDGKWEWHYGREGAFVDFTPYVNDLGLERIDSLNIEEHYDEYLEEIVRMKFELFYKLGKTTKNTMLFKDTTGEEINRELTNLRNMSATQYVERINKVKNDFQRENPDLYASHCKYLIEEMSEDNSDE